MPPYFDAFLQAIEAGVRIDHVHLGHWDLDGARVTSIGSGFEAAQDRLAENLIAMADVRPGHSVLDVGCGFGGVVRRLDSEIENLALYGLNIDARQIAVCRTIVCRAENSLAWIVGDGCRLPFAGASIDRILCVEAVFHFESRHAFFAEAFRVLASGGLLVFSDILLKRPGREFALPANIIEDILRADFGPWPEPWISIEMLHAMAEQCGFSIEADVDATANTLPSYQRIAPSTGTGLTGGAVMRKMHESGYLRYVYVTLVKNSAPPTCAGEALE